MPRLRRLGAFSPALGSALARRVRRGLAAATAATALTGLAGCSILGDALDRFEGSYGDAPEQQRLFMEVIERSQDARDGGNAVRIRKAEKNQPALLCDLLSQQSGYRIEDWVGEVASVGITDKNQAMLEVSVTPSNAVVLQSAETKDGITGIPGGSKMYDHLGRLKHGDRVTVSGEFVPHKKDCLRETYTSTWSLESAPDFAFRFDTVEPLEQ